jgi:hypothetical protein
MKAKSFWIGAALWRAPMGKGSGVDVFIVTNEEDCHAAFVVFIRQMLEREWIRLSAEKRLHAFQIESIKRGVDCVKVEIVAAVAALDVVFPLLQQIGRIRIVMNASDKDEFVAIAEAFHARGANVEGGNLVSVCHD